MVTEVGQSLARDGDCADYDVAFRKVLTDTWSGKSTLTLLKRVKRVGPLVRFASWARDAQLVAFPVHESSVYRFRDSSWGMSSATFSSQLLKSLNFAAFAVGLQGAADAASSRRVKGLAGAEKGHKRPLTQKVPSSVAMVRALESAAASSSCDSDAAIARQALLCLYARARWSDAMQVESLELDRGGEQFSIQAVTACWLPLRVALG
eukprot:5709112-Amphidinium_carterae.1